MRTVIFHPIGNLELAVHHVRQLLRIVRTKEAFLFLSVYFELLANVTLYRIPHVVDVDARTPDVNSLKAAFVNVQN